MQKILLAAVLALLLNACDQQQEKPPVAKAKPVALEGGGSYKIEASSEGKAVQPGNWLKLHVIQSYGDTILRDSRRTGPEYIKFDSAMMTAQSLQVFRNAHEGDSLSFEMPADSAFKQKRPSFVKKKGGTLLTRIRIEKILANDSAYYSEINRADTSATPLNH